MSAKEKRQRQIMNTEDYSFYVSVLFTFPLNNNDDNPVGQSRGLDTGDFSFNQALFTRDMNDITVDLILILDQC